MLRRAVYAGLAVTVLLLGVVLAITAVPGPVNAGTLGEAVRKESGTLLDNDTPCDRADRRVWRCIVPDGSGTLVRYRVDEQDGGCWSARLTRRGGEPMPERLRGCIRMLRMPSLPDALGDE